MSHASICVPHQIPLKLWPSASSPRAHSRSNPRHATGTGHRQTTDPCTHAHTHTHTEEQDGAVCLLVLSASLQGYLGLGVLFEFGGSGSRLFGVTLLPLAFVESHAFQPVRLLQAVGSTLFSSGLRFCRARFRFNLLCQSFFIRSDGVDVDARLAKTNEIKGELT